MIACMFIYYVAQIFSLLTLECLNSRGGFKGLDQKNAAAIIMLPEIGASQAMRIEKNELRKLKIS